MPPLEHRQHGVDGANVGTLAVAPAHRPGPAQSLDDSRNPLLQHGINLPAGDIASNPHVVASLQDLGGGGVVLSKKTMERLRRLTLGVIRGTARRTLDFFFPVAFPDGNVRKKKDETSRRGCDGHWSARGTDLLEQTSQLLLQCRLRG